MGDRLEGRVAIITGAGRGMGQAGAILFAQEGAKVVVAERRADAAAETADAVRAAGGTAIFVETDVTDPASVQQMAERTVEAFGGIDVLWNNVGGIGWTPEGMRRKVNLDEGGFDILNVEPDFWDWQIRINLTSVYLCCRAVLPSMIAKGKGAIINTSSGAAIARSENNHPYATAKGAVLTLTKLIAKKYGPLGIRCNAIVPRLTNSWDAEALAARAAGGKVPLGRIGTLEEIASAALFLASDESSYVTGDALWLDGGSRMGA